MQVAFVTYYKFPNLYEDDQLLQEYLTHRNIEVIVVSWDDAKINWQQFDLIILRSMWDYFERPLEFNLWLDQLEQLNCKVLNPVSVVKWNQDKNYFDDFSNKGVLLPSYVICTQQNELTLKQILEVNNWRKAVVKPTISGGAYNTWITTIDSVSNDEHRFIQQLKSGDVIVQVFVEEIISKGELSLIFFNKKFSHAICKRAKQGDFRVQFQFGGTTEAFQPDSNILTQATILINSIPETLLYARVDGVVTNDGNFLLMELELIEPVLFVSTNDKACENFYNALTKISAAQI